jgi:hypothetical protein
MTTANSLDRINEIKYIRLDRNEDDYSSQFRQNVMRLKFTRLDRKEDDYS